MPRIALRVNGTAYALDVPDGASLLAVLREDLRLTGAKQACGRGECGACTVLHNGQPVPACLVLAARAHGEIATIEGLASEAADLRREFAELGGFQCGFCTAGQVVQATALLRSPLPADPGQRAAFIRRLLSGNICRCTGYDAIIAAILRVAAMREAAA